MDAENIIYIAVTIIIFIVSLLGKPKKKQKPTPENLDEAEYTLNEFEKLLERKQEYLEPVIENEDWEEEEDPDKQPIIMGKAVHEFFNKPKEEEQKKEQPEEKEVLEDKLEDGFDVKSAIIYSSILERKKTRR